MTAHETIQTLTDLHERHRDPPYPSAYPAEWAELRDRYLMLYAIAAMKRPASIVEIGVRAGYSAFALMAGARTTPSYYGIDADDGTWGGKIGMVNRARELLYGLDGIVTITIADSMSLSRLPAADIAHVDGAHDYGHCLHDLKLCHDAGCDTIIVDDYWRHSGVKDATDYIGGVFDYRSFPIQLSPTIGCYVLERT